MRPHFPLAFIAAAVLTSLNSCGAPGQDFDRELGLGLSEEIAAQARVFEGEREVDWRAAVDRMARADVVFFGEMHNDFATHLVQRKLLRSLAAKREVVLSLEFFSWQDQDALDAFVQGEIDEARLLERASEWSNYREAHGPLLRLAKRLGVRVVGANCPRALTRKVSRGRAAALAAMSAEERKFFPSTLHAAQDSYWQRYDRLSRAHGGRAGPASAERLYWTQNLWDNAMGEAIVRARASQPRAPVLHLCGGFHSAYRQGTVHQVGVRAPGLRLVNLQCHASATLEGCEAELDARIADYNVFVRTSATDRFRRKGRYSVSVPMRLSWRLATCDAIAAQDPGPPLVLYLAGREQSEADTLSWLRACFGREAHAVAIAPPLCDGQGRPRWFERGEVGYAAPTLHVGVRRILDYLKTWLRFDATRVLLAGEGEAATLAIALARNDNAPAWHTLAVAPRELDALAGSSGSSRPHRDGASKFRLTVSIEEPADYERFATLDRDVGRPTELLRLDSDAWVARTVVREIRRHLALKQAEGQGLDRAQRPRLRHESATAKAWARTWVASRGKAGEGVLDFTSDVVEGRALAPLLAREDVQRVPRSTNDFGGTTVLLLPEREDAQGAQAWRRVVARDTSKDPRFPVRIAYEGASLDLWHALDELRDAEARSVLVVPAEFCRDRASIDAMRRSAAKRYGSWAERIEWRMGLGKSLRAERDE